MTICKIHPKYKILRKPRARCLDCWNMWANKYKEKVSQEDLDLINLLKKDLKNNER